MSDKLRRVLVDLIRENVPRQVSICEVISVDEAKLTCNVKELDSDMELVQVRLNAASTQLNTVLIPKVGSILLVALIGNNRQARYVSMVSECEKVILTGDANGGLAKVESLVSKLNALESDLNSLKSKIASWTPIANDGGAALKTALSAWYQQQLTQTVRGDIENTKVKH